MSAQPATKKDLDDAIERSQSQLTQLIADASAQALAYTDHAIQSVRGEVERSEARLLSRIDQSGTLLRRQIEESETRLMRHVAEASAHTVQVMATSIGDQLAARMGQELARHLRASDERNLDAIRTLDDQYRSLPAEVTELRQAIEAHVTDEARTHRQRPARSAAPATRAEPARRPRRSIGSRPARVDLI